MIIYAPTEIGGHREPRMAWPGGAAENKEEPGMGGGGRGLGGEGAENEEGTSGL